MSRRRSTGAAFSVVVVVLVALALVAGLAAGCRRAAQPEPEAPAAEPPKPAQLVVNSSGGIVNEALRNAYLKTFEERYGIPVVDTSPVDFAKLQAMVQSGNVEWNITEIAGTDAFRAVELGLLERIDFSVVDVKDYPPEVVHEYLLPAASFTTLMAYRKDAFPGGPPQTWADFWDVTRFPGPRALENSPVDNLEFALLADGVPPDQLYPLDVDRAFRKLDEIRPHITVWWTTGAQPAQLLVDNEVVLTSAWNARIADLIMKGAPVDMTWNQGLLKVAYMAIPKGAGDLYWTQRLLAVFAEAEAQVKWVNVIPYPGFNLKTVDLVDPGLRPFLPTYQPNLEQQVVQSAAWWNKNLDAVQERWNRWMLGGN